MKRIIPLPPTILETLKVRDMKVLLAKIDAKLAECKAQKA